MVNSQFEFLKTISKPFDIDLKVFKALCNFVSVIICNKNVREWDLMFSFGGLMHQLTCLWLKMICKMNMKMLEKQFKGELYDYIFEWPKNISDDNLANDPINELYETNLYEKNGVNKLFVMNLL